MGINIFEGSRRIALLTAGTAAVGTIAAAFLHEPYVPVTYTITHPTGFFVRTEDSCPMDAGRHYFSKNLTSGKSVSVNLCLLAMPFGEDGRKLIPYKVDDKGMVWGAATYSTEVSAYERKLEERFQITPRDEEAFAKEISRRYKENLVSSLGYLAAGLAIFTGVVWAMGWIVRGFFGIPRGMDRRPDA